MRKAQKQMLDELLPQAVVDREYGGGRSGRHAGAEHADRLERRDLYAYDGARQCIADEARKTLARLRENRAIRPGVRDELALGITRLLQQPDTAERAKALDQLDTRARQALKNT